MRLREIGRGSTQDLDLLLQSPNPLPRHTQLRRLVLGHSRLDAVLDVSLLQPLRERDRMDAEITSNLLQSLVGTTLPGAPAHVLFELLGIPASHDGPSFQPEPSS